MAQATFTPTGSTYAVSFSATAANTVMTGQSVDLGTLFKIDNASGNLAFVAFSSNAAVVANVSHPTPGVANSKPIIAVRTGETVYVNPGLGQYQGNVYIGIISVSGTGNIYIQAGV